MARGRLCVLALLGCAGVAGAFPTVAGAHDDGARLGIFVCDAARVPAGTLATAQRAAARVFAQAGVDVEWLGCTAELVADAQDVEHEIACHRPRHTHRLVLEILPHADAAAHLVRDVGGVARVYGTGQAAGCASVFYERATDLAQFGADRTPIEESAPR